MTDAPERLWAWPDRTHYGQWTSIEGPAGECREYIRRDAVCDLPEVKALVTTANDAANTIVGIGHSLRYDGLINDSVLDMFDGVFHRLRRAIFSMKKSNNGQPEAEPPNGPREPGVSIVSGDTTPE